MKKRILIPILILAFVLIIVFIGKLEDKKTKNIFESIDNDKNIIFETDNEIYLQYYAVIFTFKV